MRRKVLGLFHVEFIYLTREISSQAHAERPALGPCSKSPIFGPLFVFSALHRFYYSVMWCVSMSMSFQRRRTDAVQIVNESLPIFLDSAVCLILSFWSMALWLPLAWGRGCRDCDRHSCHWFVTFQRFSIH